MKISDIFSGSKLKLLQIFLEEEVKCYPRYIQDFYPGLEKKDSKLNTDGLNFLFELEQKIVQEISEKCPNGFNWATIISTGNAGATEYSLTIYGTGKWYNWEKPSINIYLCTCGSIKHWGSVSVQKEN